jgi:hypothetical protein
MESWKSSAIIQKASTPPSGQTWLAGKSYVNGGVNVKSTI